MKKYTYLQHTADAKFQAFGFSLEQAFTHAALATAGLMWDCDKIETRHEHHILISGSDEKQLLANFLEEILFLLDTQMFLLGRVKDLTIENKEGIFLLEACLVGDFLSGKYSTFGEVKAITYNEMEIRKDKHVMVQVVVDM